MGKTEEVSAVGKCGSVDSGLGITGRAQQRRALTPRLQTVGGFASLWCKRQWRRKLWKVVKNQMLVSLGFGNYICVQNFGHGNHRGSGAQALLKLYADSGR